MPIAQTRRDVLLSAVALAAAPILPAWGQRAGVVTMGVITPTTGTFAYAGDLVARGASLALEMHGGSVLGNAVRLLTRDDEGKPASGVRRVQEAATSDGMRYFIGAYSSAVGLAESEVAQREKLLQFAAGGSEDFTGSRCGRYTFQWSAHPYTAMRATLEYVRKTFPQKKTIYTLTADYVFGHALLKYTKIVAAELGFELVGNDNHPSGERQYTQYLTKAVAARPDILLLNTAGADAVTAVRQFASFGAENIAVVGPWSLEVDQLAELAPEMRTGLVLGQNYYPDIDTPTNKEFVGSYTKKFSALPGYSSAYAYDAVRALLMAMEKANSTEVPDVIKTLEQMSWDGVLGRMSIDPKTHQLIRPYFVVRCKQASDMRHATDFADIVANGDKPQPPELNECKQMPAL
ncbi:ABC transporter substrate-binding protein [Bradyrhizobium neotropicale]|uniref:ABC transporter substrate-binding protein n=1 Tax=Bradyrhizobium neotropicale TaxID=1497615 RepID=UPI001AD6DBDF|nr:ABC transporter substrate-binding protein [Bradyrhizobium neotropicale]MBO4223871.1 ABC transporter substrate-binding protein [Bradyrhizobium neotropicale]